jgi:hypothetical protein
MNELEERYNNFRFNSQQDSTLFNPFGVQYYFSMKALNKKNYLLDSGDP